MKHKNKVETIKLYKAEANCRFDKSLFSSMGKPFYIIVMSAIVTINILFTTGLTILKFYILINLVSDIYFKSSLFSIFYKLAVKQVSGPDRPLAFQSLTVMSSIPEDQITPNPLISM